AVASVGGSQTAGAKPFGLRSRVSLLLVSSGDDSIQFGGLQQVFRPAGGLLSATCILDREHGNLKTAVQHFVAPIPGGVEVQPRDGRHHVDTNRLAPELINKIGIEEIVNRNVAERWAKTSKRSIGALSVRAVGGYPQIQVLGVVRLRVFYHRVSADNQKLNRLFHEVPQYVDVI